MNRSQYDPLEDEDTLRIMQNLSQLKGQSSKRQVLTGQMPIPEAENNLFNVPGNSSAQSAPAAQGAPPPAVYEDIRANQITNPEVQQKNIMTRFGQALGDLVNIMGSKFGGKENQTPAAKSPPQYMHAGMSNPPMNANPSPESGLQYMGAKPGDLERGLAATPESQKLINQPIPKPSQSVQFPPQDSSLYSDPFATTVNPLTPRTLNPQRIASNGEEVQQIVASKQEEPPASYPVQGAASVALNDPQIKAQLEQITGQQYDPQDASLLKSYEQAADAFGKSLDEVSGQLDQQAMAIKQRLESRKLTTQDKIMMGAVLLAPALISGLMGGGESAIAALSAGTGALAKNLQERETQDIESKDKLLNVGVQKASLSGQKLEPLAQLAKLRKDLRPDKIKPGKPTLKEKFDERMQMENIEQGEDGKVYDNIFGLKVPIEAIRNEDDLKKYKDEYVPDASEAMQLTDRAVKRLDDIIHIMDQLGADEEGSRTKNFLTATGQKTGFRTQVKLADGRSVDAETELKRLIGLLNDDYRKSQNMRALTNTVKDHFDSLVQLPFDASILSGNVFKNTLDQAIGLRKDLIGNVTDYMKKYKIDTSDYENQIKGSKTSRKLEDDEQGNAISQYLLSNPDAQKQASQTGKFSVGK